jgi:hypothetical protein
MRRLMLAVACIALPIGAGATYKKNRDYRPPTASPAHAAVIEIAKKAVFSNPASADQAIYKPSLIDGVWNVLVQRIMGYDLYGHPMFTPGAHCLVLIDREGNVLRIIPGM